MDAYELQETRFVQEFLNGSAANGLNISAGPVPKEKTWTVMAASAYPSVAETRTVFFAIVTAGGSIFPVTTPVSIALSPTILFPLVSEGMEIRLLPGDSLRFIRDVATAGSTIELRIRYVEADLPYFVYDEPQKKLVKMKQRRISVTPTAALGFSPTTFPTYSIPPVGVPRGGGGGGGGGEPQPV